MATINPATGAVMAIYGGSDYLTRNRNAATQDEAVAGSTFKPFALVAALEDGLSLRSRFDGHSPQVFDGFDGKKVSNFGDEQFGMIDLVKATEHSVNTVFVGLNEKIGADHTYAAAVAAGIPQSTAGLDKNPANVLGGASPHPIDMASAYATFAAGGIYHKPYVIQQVSPIGGGKATFIAHPKGVREFTPDVMADAVYAMQQVVKHGTGVAASNLDRPAAGKTGTSSSNLSAWFVGFTPQMSTAVAMYRVGKDGNPMQLTHILGKAEVTGGSYPTILWTDYMGLALNNVSVLPFPDPTFGGEVLNPAPVFTPTPSDTSSLPTVGPTPTGTFTGTPTPTLPTGPPTGSNPPGPTPPQP